MTAQSAATMAEWSVCTRAECLARSRRFSVVPGKISINGGVPPIGFEPPGTLCGCPCGAKRLAVAGLQINVVRLSADWERHSRSRSQPVCTPYPR